MEAIDLEVTIKLPDVDWYKIREKFMDECVDKNTSMLTIPPEELTGWFRNQIFVTPPKKKKSFRERMVEVNNV